MGKWRRRVERQALTIDSLHRQIEGMRAYERTLQQSLEIAKKDAADARQWAERAERAEAATWDAECEEFGCHGD